jgi:hypothetical protein
MLESGVICRRKYVMNRTELFDIPQTLKLRSIYDFHQESVEFNLTINRILENLKIKQFKSFDGFFFEYFYNLEFFIIHLKNINLRAEMRINVKN